MTETYVLHLNLDQLQILLETAEGFIDNKKLLHVPDRSGEVVALPLTVDGLRQIKSVMEENGSKDREEINIALGRTREESTKITISLLDHDFVYEVNEEEFDPL